METKAKHRRILVWLRRAMRADDNAALWHAIQDADEIIPVLVLSDDPTYDIDSPRRRFVRNAIGEADRQLRERSSQLHVRIGQAAPELAAAAGAYGATAVYAAAVYDAPALRRDAAIRKALSGIGVDFLCVKDRVLRESQEIRTGTGGPYKIFTPYKRGWLSHADELPRPFPDVGRLTAVPLAAGSTSPDRLWRHGGPHRLAGGDSPEKRLASFVNSSITLYDRHRDLPAIDGTSKLSHHLALGTLSPRRLYWTAAESFRQYPSIPQSGIDTFISELIWREFYYHIMTTYPYVLETSFKEEFRDIQWRRSPSAFERWKSGMTGFPIVDAGMRQLNQEGWMHNRARMIVASFLTKDLHINWQWGEQYFKRRLIDLDLAANNGGWQWTAGTGTDASPWFRIFNPITQGKKFDPEGDYVRHYVPELARIPGSRVHEPWRLTHQDQRAYGCIVGKQYPKPMVDHSHERLVTTSIYGKD
jgi:deoxyribodipyrimidine photo-lyase